MLVEVEGSVGKEEEQAKEVTVNVVLIYGELQLSLPTCARRPV